MMAVVNTALTGYDATFPIAWYDDDSTHRPKGRSAHAEVGVYHTAGAQATMGTVATGRTFRRYGYLEVLVHTPEGDGLTLADELATIVHDALEGVTTGDGVIFRNVQAVEEGKSGSFRVTNVTADFEYDQIR
jgi:ActR/RegA family two-component response regulator